MHSDAQVTFTMHIVFDWLADEWEWSEPWDNVKNWTSDVHVARAMAKLGLMPIPCYK